MMNWSSGQLAFALKFLVLDGEMSEQVRESKGKETLEECLLKNSWDTYITADGREALQNLYNTGTSVGCAKIKDLLERKDLRGLMLVSDQHPLKDMVQVEAMSAIAKINRRERRRACRNHCRVWLPGQHCKSVEGSRTKCSCEYYHLLHDGRDREAFPKMFKPAWKGRYM